tara:strand:- start:51964 stop:53016 length:1053 start_codon:yes stop_codon:yes gene_type:complete
MSHNPAQASINTLLSQEEKIHLYREMVRIRRFEERSVRSYQQGHIGGFCHVYNGQEAVAAGTISVLGPDDHIITAYRDHAHALMVGMDMNSLMAELYGKETGCSKGKGGSMHFFDPSKNFWGGHGIVGGQTPLGAGLAFALKYQGKKGACLTYLGDGAVNQGPFYEALNLASLWNLPLIYIIENNQYSMGTSQERGCAGDTLAGRGSGFGIYNEVIEEGNDVYTIRERTSEALQRAYEEQRPSILEIKTYRYRGHSMSDPDKTYRSKEEIEEYKKTSDPIDRFQEQLVGESVLSVEQAEAINKEAKEEAERAVEFAEQSDFPTKEAIQQDIFWETDNPEQGSSQGTFFFN